MSKVSFTKLKLKSKDSEVQTFDWEENKIEVKQYLPIDKKLELIQEVLKLSIDDNNFVNPAKQEVFFYLNVIYFYTNISFTDNQKASPTKLFDAFESTGFINNIISLIPEDEFNILYSYMINVADYFQSTMTSIPQIVHEISNNSVNSIPEIEKFLESVKQDGTISNLQEIIKH